MERHGVMKNPRRKPRLGKGRKSWARIRAAARLAEFWGRRWADRRERWEANPETKDKEMEAIFRKVKSRAKARLDERRGWCHNLPDSIHSKDINAELGRLLERLGKPFSPADVHALKVYLRRDGLIAFDNVEMVWRVAKR